MKIYDLIKVLNFVSSRLEKCGVTRNRIELARHSDKKKSEWFSVLEEEEDMLVSFLNANQIKIYQAINASSYVGVQLRDALDFDLTMDAGFDERVRSSHKFEEAIRSTRLFLKPFSNIISDEERYSSPGQVQAFYKTLPNEIGLDTVEKYTKKLRSTLNMLHQVSGRSYEEPEIKDLGIGSVFFDFVIDGQVAAVLDFILSGLESIINSKLELMKSVRVLQKQGLGSVAAVVQEIEEDSDKEISALHEKIEQKLDQNSLLPDGGLVPELRTVLKNLIKSIAKDLDRGHMYTVLQSSKGDKMFGAMLLDGIRSRELGSEPVRLLGPAEDLSEAPQDAGTDDE